MYQLIIFDFDDCIDSLVESSEGKVVFSELVKKYKIGLASYNYEADYLLKKHRVYSYFSEVIATVHPSRASLNRPVVFQSKTQMIEAILGKLNICPEKAIFFDDQERNCVDVRKAGVKSILVAPHDTVDMLYLEKHLREVPL
jgi:FMN phosphatase YigB (HAD superfamily)